MADSNEPSYWRDVITGILSEDNDDFDIADSDLVSRKKWRTRRFDKNKTIPGYDHGSYYTEWEREIQLPDGDVESVYDEVTVEFASHYVKGSSGSYYEPPEPSGYEDTHVIWIELTDPANAHGGPLTPKEMDAIEQWFDEHANELANEVFS